MPVRSEGPGRPVGAVDDARGLVRITASAWVPGYPIGQFRYDLGPTIGYRLVGIERPAL